MEKEFNTLLEYEISNSFLARIIWFDWGQTLVSKYLIWKTIRKHKRYIEFANVKQLLNISQN